MKTKTRLEKIDETFFRELEEISLKNTQKSGYKPSIRRLTKAVRRHNQWPIIKEDIINTQLDDDRGKNE